MVWFELPFLKTRKGFAFRKSETEYEFNDRKQTSKSKLVKANSIIAYFKISFNCIGINQRTNVQK